MTTGTPRRSGEGDSPETPPDLPAGGFWQKIITACMVVLAFAAMLLLEPARYLTGRVYGEARLAGLRRIVGLVLAAGGAIGVGYFCGWHLQTSLTTWLLFSVLSVFVVYYYLWPAIYLLIAHWSFDFSAYLWRQVPGPGDSSSPRSWASGVLSLVLAIVVGLAALGGIGYLAWHTGHSVYVWFDAEGAFTNFLAAAFGFFCGGMVAWVVGFVAVSAILEAAMPTVALLGGIALAWWSNPWLTELNNSWQAPQFLVHLGEAAIAAVFAGYVFPVCHIALSHLCGGLFSALKRLFGRLSDAVYEDRDVVFVNFTRQAAGLAFAVWATLLAFAYLQSSLGPVVAAALSFALALIVYLVGAGLFVRISNRVLGTVFAAALAYWEFFTADWQYFHGGLLVSGAQALVVLLLASRVLFPVLYIVVKALTRRLLASWLGPFLTRLHESLGTEILSSYRNTYGDRSGCERLLPHLVNLAFAALAAYLTGMFALFLQLSAVFALVAQVVACGFSYIFVGKLLLRFGNHLLGGAIALFAAAYTGVEVFAQCGQNYWYAVPAFLAAGAVTYGLIYPVCYVVLRSVLRAANAVRLYMPLESIHQWCYSFVEAFWNRFVAVYAQLKVAIAPYFGRLAALWAQSLQIARRSFDKVFKRSGH